MVAWDEIHFSDDVDQDRLDTLSAVIFEMVEGCAMAALQGQAMRKPKSPLEPSELEKVRAEAARTQAEWRIAKDALDAKLTVANARGETPSGLLQIEIDQYNRLNVTNSAVQHRAAELERQEAERIKITDEASITTEYQERAFWFRRFHTSLAIAHGAAFAAIGSKLFDKDTNAQTAAAAWHPMALFALGMVIAGAHPLALHRRNERIGWGLAGVSAVLFVAGLIAALAAIWRKADLVLPALRLS